MSHSDVTLIINYERPFQGKIEIIRRCINMNIRIFLFLSQKQLTSHNSKALKHF